MVERIFYETDNLDVAFKKRKKVEYTSNVDTDSEKERKRRKIIAKKLAFNNSSSNSEAEKVSSVKQPKTIKISQKSNSSISSNEEGDVRMTSPQSISSLSTSLTPRSINNTPAEPTPSRNRPRDEAGQDVRFNKKGFYLLLEHILTIKEQNKQMLALLTQIQAERQIYPDNPFDLRLKSYDDVKAFEEYLKASKENCEKMISYLATLGGSGTVSITNRILKYLISDLAATKFNYFGSRSNKEPFHKLEIKKLILSAVLKNRQGIRDIEVENAMKVWLKHAPQRHKNMLKKQTRNDDPEAQST
ncbi:uncharacterized protein LOC105830832 [Monomorium pharaonis]|uniref:uncharacterized protein LOC105830832 n=1 Tax=Monomorium pharaonis TaxID=307658 RepID=UPI001745FAD5|nr:uncharacterized protein LOC105830832 [Monomorium pharaonis]XP_036141270.1 uncharacterized protein LOC105830832 [Monomorium pharaonis]XP_036141271.1 uncharacterized protein LOC105830832 [Monomorium pharaonis]